MIGGEKMHKYVSMGLWLLGMGFTIAGMLDWAALSWAYLAGRCAAIDGFAK